MTLAGEGPRSRRNAAQLEAAIYDAVLAELGEVGFHRLTFDSVALRAGTGKSALYRRWANKKELVLDTLSLRTPEVAEFNETGDLRTDLIRFLLQMTAGLDGIAGIGIRSLIGASRDVPEVLVELRERVGEPRRRQLAKLLRSAAKRGDFPIESLTLEVLEVIPALCTQRYIVDGGRMSEREIRRMVDRVVLPLLIRDRPHGRPLHSL
jgi:AcrR family transcriptional regulator